MFLIMNTPNHENGDTVETYLTHILTTIDLYSPTTTQPVLTRNHDVRTKGGTYAMDQIARGLLYKLCDPDCLVDPLCTQQEEEEEGEPMEHTSSPNIHIPEEESIPKLQNQNPVSCLQTLNALAHSMSVPESPPLSRTNWYITLLTKVSPYQQPWCN